MAFTTLEDIIRFAVKREEAAYQLYKTAAEQSTSIAARKMFEEMAAEEAGHKEVFSRIEVAEAMQNASAKLPDMKLAEYMVDMPLKPNMTYDEILRYAIKTEDSAFKLYSAAVELTDDPKLKKTLQVFANVEMGHKKRLEEIYDDKVLTEM